MNNIMHIYFIQTIVTECNIKKMPLECQLQYLAQFGFQVPDVAGAVEVEQAQKG